MWKVLVVDDNFVNRQLLVEILRGHAVCDVAANGAEAMLAYNYALTKGGAYDVILLDIAMPEVDGLMFLSTVRQQEHAAGVSLGDGVPIIMVTAFEKPFMKAFNHGCDDYMIKPINGEVLLSKIRSKIRTRQPNKTESANGQ